MGKMKLPLSVLDLIPMNAGATAHQAFERTLELGQLTDRLGFTRYWVAEHHNTSGLASSTPEIALALLGRETTRIRVGSGGVMLPNHSPLKVAETFRTLEALYPGRVDLGLGRAPGTDQLTAFALRRSMERLQADDFPEQIHELQAYCGERPFPVGLPFEKIIASPDGVPLPPLYILSSSGYGARLAAAIGRGFAFAHHFSPAAAAESMRAYRAQYRPSDKHPTPHAILTVSVICSDTEARAEQFARCVDLMWLRFHRGDRRALPTIAEAQSYPFTAAENEQAKLSRAMLTWGTPPQVKEKLLGLATELKADELMVNTHVPVHEERLHSYELLADAFGLPRA